MNTRFCFCTHTELVQSGEFETNVQKLAHRDSEWNPSSSAGELTLLAFWPPRSKIAILPAVVLPVMIPCKRCANAKATLGLAYALATPGSGAAESPPRLQHYVKSPR